MSKYSFKNDYSEGAHESILALLADSNRQQVIGYGEDEYCKRAAELIKAKCEQPNAAVHFVSGGTQANQIVIASQLRPYESVIAAVTGHIAVHETGAIESVGHKINTVNTADGKLRPSDIDPVLQVHNDEHSVKPRMVYISNATELGTIYSKNELEVLSQYCKSKGLLLYIDGARLAQALSAKDSDLSLADIAQLADIFYLGGTKNGALLGEAIVIVPPELQVNFRFHIKQQGAMLAKGRLLGIQFCALMEHDLFLDLARHSNEMAGALASIFETHGFAFLTLPESNQVFPILPNELIDKLAKLYGFYVWKKIDEAHSAIRMICSWATPKQVIDAFSGDFAVLLVQK